MTLRLVPDAPNTPQVPRSVPVPAFDGADPYLIVFSPDDDMMTLWHGKETLLAGLSQGAVMQVQHLHRHATGSDDGGAAVFLPFDGSTEDAPGYAVVVDPEQNFLVVYGPHTEDALAACRDAADAVAFLLDGPAT